MLDSTASDIQILAFFHRVVYPMGKPMIPHLLRYHGLAVNNYSYGPDALDLEHPRLLQH